MAVVSRPLEHQAQPRLLTNSFFLSVRQPHPSLSLQYPLVERCSRRRRVGDTARLAVNRGAMLKDLIDLCWARYARLKRAVAADDGEALAGIDTEVESLLDAIFERKATNAIEVRMQVRFVIDLLRAEADDPSSVLRHAENLQSIVERHLCPAAAGELYHHVIEAAPVTVTSRVKAEHGLLDIVLLERLPNRVSVIAPDYRYLYCNEMDAAAWGHPATEIHGRHISAMLGERRFEQGFRGKLDCAFVGETVDYTFADPVGGRMRVLRCRLSPYRATCGNLIGALVLMEEIADRRQRCERAA